MFFHFLPLPLLFPCAAFRLRAALEQGIIPFVAFVNHFENSMGCILMHANGSELSHPQLWSDGPLHPWKTYLKSKQSKILWSMEDFQVMGWLVIVVSFPTLHEQKCLPFSEEKIKIQPFTKKQHMHAMNKYCTFKGACEHRSGSIHCW